MLIIFHLQRIAANFEALRREQAGESAEIFFYVIS